MSFSPLLEELITALRVLPGVGPKSAQRMAFHLLQRKRDAALSLASSLQRAMHTISYCERCRTFTEMALCRLCSMPERENGQLCVVGSASDVLSFEHSGGFRGRYFVLHGLLSPIDGVGPSDIGIETLLSQLDNGTITEVILATNTTVEGEATAHYLASRIKPLNIRTSRLAYGVPVGSDFEYTDISTLLRAFNARDTV